MPPAGFDFVVLDDVTPTVWPSGNVLAIHVVNTNWFWKGYAVEAPAIVGLEATHPLLRYSGFDNVQVMQSLATKTPTWAVSICWTLRKPRSWSRANSGGNALFGSASILLESNWPLRVSFPFLSPTPSNGSTRLMPKMPSC